VKKLLLGFVVSASPLAIIAATALFTVIPEWAKAQSLTPPPESAPSQSVPTSAREAAMQAEIAALKAENRELRKRHDRPATASAAAATPLTTPLAASSSTPSLAPRAPARPAEAYAMASGSSPGASSIWTGAYAGASVGLGGENTRATTNFSSFNAFALPGFMGTDSRNSLVAGDRQFGVGGVADVFIGYNRQMNDWVGGVQLEGTLARFNERLARTNTLNEVVTTNGAVTSISQSSQSQLDTLSQNWAVTAAARLGRLVTAHDLIYGLAGWSFANFSTSIESDSVGADRTFNTSGPTVGIGWERQLADQWTIRAEYRYTHFLDKTLSTSSPTASADNAGHATTISSTSQSTISADSHIVRFGVARAFGG
jgi:opacity protein-like surface antigen